MKAKMPVSDSLEAIAMRQEAKRFESVCPNIQSLYDLLEEIDNVPLKRKMRELVNRIEGKLKIFSGGYLKTIARSLKLLDLRNGQGLQFCNRGFSLTN